LFRLWCDVAFRGLGAVAADLAEVDTNAISGLFRVRGASTSCADVVGDQLPLQ
jgi:hypothetical protein